MIYCLTGDLIYSDVVNCTAVIDCGGVGYKVTATASAISKLPPPSENGGVRVRIFTYMNVKEDGVDLFGFASEEELRMFSHLISVSGVGPKAGISILSVMSPEKVASAVISDDAKAIAKAPGIGAKTAARVILELKDKLSKLYSVSDTDDSASVTAAPVTNDPSSDVRDAADALIVLGYSASEVKSVLSKLGDVKGTENIIRAALAKLL